MISSRRSGRGRGKAHRAAAIVRGASAAAARGVPRRPGRSGDPGPRADAARDVLRRHGNDDPARAAVDGPVLRGAGPRGSCHSAPRTARRCCVRTSGRWSATTSRPTSRIRTASRSGGVCSRRWRNTGRTTSPRSRSRTARRRSTRSSSHGVSGPNRTATGPRPPLFASRCRAAASDKDVLTPPAEKQRGGVRRHGQRHGRVVVNRLRGWLVSRIAGSATPTRPCARC